MGDTALWIVLFCTGVVVYTILMWLAAKITKAEAGFVELLIIAVIVTPLGFIPGVFGWIVSVVVLFTLLYKWAGIDPFPDAVLMVLVARVLYFVMALTIVRLISG
jgi:hypothetical protein